MNRVILTKRSFRFLSFGLIWVTAALNTSLLPASADPSKMELERGIESFNSKHYSDAVAHLQFYINSAPNDSLGHYYMANCLFNLGYQKPCIDEYAKALRDSTSQKMTDYCRDAIRSMQSSKQATVSPRPAIAAQPSYIVQNSVDINPTAVEGLEQMRWTNPALAARFRNVRIPLADMPPVMPINQNGVVDLALEKTLVHMNEQTNIMIENLRKANVEDQASSKEHLTDDIFRIKRDSDIRIQALYDSDRYSRGSSQLDSAAEAIRKDAVTRIESAQRSYDQSLEANNQRLAQQIQKVQLELNQAQNQVVDSRRMHDSPNLQLAGTDLYTRTYTPSPSPPPPDELVATPERLILDAHSRPGRTISRVVRDPSEPPPSPPGTDLKVHGQVIK